LTDFGMDAQSRSNAAVIAAVVSGGETRWGSTKGNTARNPAWQLLKLTNGRPRRLVKIAQRAAFFVVKIAHLGIFICGFSCRTASNNEEWTSRSPL
jgi:hypothetical protein